MEQRIRPLKSIRTEEEYESYKKSLERYLIEYRWYKKYENSEDAYKAIIEKASKYEENSPAWISLTQRGKLISEGRYEQRLEKNITAYKIVIDEHEAKKENRSLLSIIKGIIKNDSDTKEYLQRRFLKSRIESKVPQILEISDLLLEDKDDVIIELLKDSINIPALERSLVPVNPKLNKIYIEANKLRDKYLAENGVSRSSSIPKTLERKITSQGSPKHNTKELFGRNPEEKDQIGDEI